MNLGSFLLSSVLLLHRIDLTFGIRLRKFGVPGAVASGSDLWLHCDFDLEGDSLYSVKWYKNNVEFYRYKIESPLQKPEHRVFHQAGIHIDLEKSNTTHVFLERTDMNTEGTFGCEVSTEAPVYSTVKAEKDLRIYVSPLEELRIMKNESKYSTGDLVNLTCTGGPARPAVLLFWFINGNQVLPGNGTYNLTKTLTERDPDGLIVTKLNLLFYLSDFLLNGDLSLRCESLFATVYGVTYEELVIGEKGISTAVKEGGTDYEMISDAVVNPKEDQEELSPPQIEGHLSRYDIGDSVEINCTSSPAYPPTFLEWFVNDKEAEEKELIKYSPDLNIQGSASISESAALFSETRPAVSTLGLHLKIAKEHYQTTDNFLRLRCTATHAKLISKSKKELHLFNGRHTSQLFASAAVTNGMLEPTRP